MKATLATGLMLTAFAGDPSPTGADPVGADVGQTQDTGAQPDANPHGYCFAASFSTTTWQNWTHDSFEITDAHSAMDRAFGASCVTSGSPQTDVVMRNVNLPGAIRGSAPCDRYHEAGTCDRYSLNIDIDEILDQSSSDSPFENNVRKTICHEIGHSMGLTHYKSANFPDPPVANQHDCMISGVVNGNTTWLVYGAHHKNHINNEF